MPNLEDIYVFVSENNSVESWFVVNQLSYDCLLYTSWQRVRESDNAIYKQALSMGGIIIEINNIDIKSYGARLLSYLSLIHI